MRIAPVGLLRVLAERELDALRRADEQEVVGPAAPAPLDDLVLAADRVGRAVQHVGRRRAAGELAVDRHVEGVDHVADAHLGRDVVRALVHVAVDRRVRVGVDDAGRDVLAAAVDLDGSGRRGEPLPDGRDLAVDDDEVRVLEDPRRTLRPDRRAAHDDGRGRRDRAARRGPEAAARRASPAPRASPPSSFFSRLLRVLQLDPRSVDPDLRDAALFGEGLAGLDDEVGDLAGLDRAEAVLQAELPRRDRRHRRQRVVGRQAARHRLAHALAEVLRVLEARRREGKLEAGVLEPLRIRRRTVEGAQPGQRNIQPLLLAVELFGLRKVDAQDEVGLDRDDLAARAGTRRRRRRNGPSASSPSRHAPRAGATARRSPRRRPSPGPPRPAPAPPHAARNRGRAWPAGCAA